MDQTRAEMQRQAASMSQDLERAQRDAAAAAQRGGDWEGRLVTAAEAERMAAELAALQDQLQVRRQTLRDIQKLVEASTDLFLSGTRARAT